MSTAYYRYDHPAAHGITMEEALKRKKLLGVRTYENKKQCFTWQMNPGEFMYELSFYAESQCVVDEYGNKMLVSTWLEQLKQIDIMRYNRDEPLELEGQRAGPGGDLAKGGCADAPGAGKGSGRGGPAVTTQEAIALCQEIEASTLDLLSRVDTHLTGPDEDYRNKGDSVERCLDMVGGQLMEAWSHAGRAINRLMKLRDQEIGQELAQLHGHAEEGNKTRQAD